MKRLPEITVARGLLTLAGCILICVGVFVTPALLIKLGPMRTSLTSHHETTRQVAYLTIAIGRLSVSLVGTVLVLAGTLLPRIAKARYSRWFIHFQSSFRPSRGEISFAAMFACTAVAMLIFWLEGRIWDEHRYYRVFGSENGFFELGSVVVLITIAVLAGRNAWNFVGATRWRVTLGLLALAAFFAAGEELSWGQHLFHWQQMEIFKGNAQNENNIHNQFGYLFDHVFILGVIVIGVIVPLCACLLPSVYKIGDVLGIPVPSPGLAIGFLLASLFQPYVLKAITGQTFKIRPAEVREWLTLIGIAILMLEISKWRPSPLFQRKTKRRIRSPEKKARDTSESLLVEVSH
ncbi:MAG: hypothetical protein KDA87_10240 [Planctomycetales bacterium]|nr:hypothetical protein [Planctomycetales bacterium]